MAPKTSDWEKIFQLWELRNHQIQKLAIGKRYSQLVKDIILGKPQFVITQLGLKFTEISFWGEGPYLGFAWVGGSLNSLSFFCYLSLSLSSHCWQAAASVAQNSPIPKPPPPPPPPPPACDIFFSSFYQKGSKPDDHSCMWPALLCKELSWLLLLLIHQPNREISWGPTKNHLSSKGEFPNSPTQKKDTHKIKRTHINNSIICKQFWSATTSQFYQLQANLICNNIPVQPIQFKVHFTWLTSTL